MKLTPIIRLLFYNTKMSRLVDRIFKNEFMN